MEEYTIGANGNWYVDGSDSGIKASPTHPVYLPSLGSGGGGTLDHTKLTNRDAAAQHPITAINVPAEYIPTNDSDLLTKKYTDDAIDDAISDAVADGGIIDTAISDAVGDAIGGSY